VTKDLFIDIVSFSSFPLLKKQKSNFKEIVKMYMGVEPAIFMLSVLLFTIGPQKFDTLKQKMLGMFFIIQTLGKKL